MPFSEAEQAQQIELLQELLAKVCKRSITQDEQLTIYHIIVLLGEMMEGNFDPKHILDYGYLEFKKEETQWALISINEIAQEINQGLNRSTDLEERARFHWLQKIFIKQLLNLYNRVSWSEHYLQQSPINVLFRLLSNNELTLSLESLYLDINDLTEERWKTVLCFIQYSGTTELRLSGQDLSILNTAQWSMICEILKNSNIDTLNCVFTNFAKVTIDHWELLGEACRVSNVSSLYMGGNSFSEQSSDYWSSICNVLINSEISSLYITGIHWFDLSKMKSFEEMIRKSKITSLNLMGNSFDKLDADRWEIFCNVLQWPNIQSINLDMQMILALDDDRRQELRDALRKSHINSLAFSFIVDVELGVTEWMKCGDVLNGTGIKSLDLSGCEMRSYHPVQWKTLGTIIKETGIVVLNLSHTEIGSHDRFESSDQYWPAFFTFLQESGITELNLSDVRFKQVFQNRDWRRQFIEAIKNSKIRSLNLSRNDFYGVNLDGLIKDSQLTTLDLSDSRIRLSRDSEWSSLSKSLEESQLTELRLGEIGYPPEFNQRYKTLINICNNDLRMKHPGLELFDQLSNWAASDSETIFGPFLYQIKFKNGSISDTSYLFKIIKATLLFIGHVAPIRDFKEEGDLPEGISIVTIKNDLHEIATLLEQVSPSQDKMASPYQKVAADLLVHFAFLLPSAEESTLFTEGKEELELLKVKNKINWAEADRFFHPGKSGFWSSPQKSATQEVGEAPDSDVTQAPEKPSHD